MAQERRVNSLLEMSRPLNNNGEGLTIYENKTNQVVRRSSVGHSGVPDIEDAALELKRRKELLSILKEQSNCRKKVKYKSEIAADYDIAYLWSYQKRNLVKYECRWCYCWHLTHGKWRPDYGQTRQKARAS